MLGPGRYDALCTLARARAKARAALLIVIGGEHGDGFSAQLSREDMATVVRVLREVAATLEEDIRAIDTTLKKHHEN
jgi:hypothetical protein